MTTATMQRVSSEILWTAEAVRAWGARETLEEWARGSACRLREKTHRFRPVDVSVPT